MTPLIKNSIIVGLTGLLMIVLIAANGNLFLPIIPIIDVLLMFLLFYIVWWHKKHPYSKIALSVELFIILIFAYAYLAGIFFYFVTQEYLNFYGIYNNTYMFFYDINPIKNLSQSFAFDLFFNPIVIIGWPIIMIGIYVFVTKLIKNFSIRLSKKIDMIAIILVMSAVVIDIAFSIHTYILYVN